MTENLATDSLSIGNIYGKRNPSRDKAKRLLEMGAADKSGYMAPIFGLLAGMEDSRADDYDRAMAEQMQVYYSAKSEGIRGEEQRKSAKFSQETASHEADMFQKHEKNAAVIALKAKEVYADTLQSNGGNAEDASRATDQFVNRLMSEFKIPMPPFMGTRIGPDNMMQSNIVLAVNPDGSYQQQPVKQDARGNMWTPAGAPDETGKVQWKQLDAGAVLTPEQAKKVQEVTDPKNDFSIFYRSEKAAGKTDAEISKAWEARKVRLSTAGRAEAQPDTTYLLTPDGKGFDAFNKKDLATIKQKLAEGYSPVDPGTIQMKNLEKDIPAPAPEKKQTGVGEYIKGLLGKEKPVAAPSGNVPPVAGARQAPDGKWYLPDPKRPGKYLMVQ
ncbi:MAG TPA: hypothetical protein VLH56_13170 [Dissulfurispiraceae bacterium]|nr:hypothetical protein [Dissulfurispiraceae bacterium]